MNIIPGTSIGPYVIGMIRVEAHAQSASRITPFFKTPASAQPTDDIEDLGLHIHYDNDDRCCVIEAWTPVSSRADVLTLEGTPIERKTMKELRDILAEQSISAEIHDEGFEDASQGIGVYCHGFSSEDALLDGVYVFKPRTHA